MYKQKFRVLTQRKGIAYAAAFFMTVGGAVAGFFSLPVGLALVAIGISFQVWVVGLALTLFIANVEASADKRD